MTSPLTRDQHRRFDDRGLVRLPGLIARESAEAMADRLWAEMARKHAIRRDDPATWRAERPAQFGPLQKTGAFNTMATPQMRAVLDELIGAWPDPGGWGLPLVCFPTPDVWALPHKVWHLDLTPDPRNPGLRVGRVFLLLAPLRPRGGGTLVATGSHRIIKAIADGHSARLSSQEVRQKLARGYPWFADLMAAPKGDEDRIARFMGAETVVDRVPLQVEEITGEAGDVFLMHPHALHAGSANALDTPRLALTQTIYPTAWSGAY